VIERAKLMVGGAELRERLGIGSNQPLLVVLPGSRTSEIRFILPTFRAAVAKIAERLPNLATVVPTVPHVASLVRGAVRDWPVPLHLIEDEANKFAAMSASNAALAASGTVTTELALARTPMVVAYRVGWLTYLLARPLVLSKWITLVNLLLDRGAVPEFLQGAATPQKLADAVVTLMTDARAADEQRSDLELATKLLGQGSEAPSLRAARAILQFVGG
jgi:lipid-A-disaccharide synthase